MKEELKTEIIEIIEEIDFDKSTKKSIIDFIRTYDGTNYDEFASFLSSLVSILTKLSENSVKAAGYDALKSIEDGVAHSMKILKNQYDTLVSGKLPKSPPVPTKEDTEDGADSENNSE